MFDDMLEHYYYEDINESIEEAVTLKMNMNDLPDKELLEKILKNTSVNALNNVTKHFPAGDVAKKYQDNGWNLSVKQRASITNVYVYIKTGINPRKLSKELFK